MSPRTGLDRERVIREAATLADEAGLEHLSLARLAERLAVRVPSLYNHVAGLRGLRRELALLSTRELANRLSRAAIGKAGDVALVAIADAYRAFARERPGLYAAQLRAPDPRDPELIRAADEVVAIALAVLAPYGLRDDDALHAVRGLRSIVHGFVTLEGAGGFGLPLDLDESFRRLVAAFVRGLRVED
ncbi:MAG: WHG domain-containing protein [Chloroflexota bacterium]|nr:WHG domain-containing protein [Chloroflexota bacterium]